ncbi:MAG: metallophosphoesterase family protein [Armatimonadetes bacterium]|nr:metallophosphoesterase family protein [Armatimonadota bacterium]
MKLAFLSVLGATSLVGLATLGTLQGRGGGGGQGRPFPPPSVGWNEGRVLLGTPERTSMGFTFHLKSDATATLKFGPEGKAMSSQSEPITVKASEPKHFILEGLKPDTSYSYQVSLRKSDGETVSPTYHFQTQRSAGKPFTFIVQGDSHPERNPKMNVPSLYERTLLTAATLKPDFFICLGDDFSVDTLRERTLQTVDGVYAKQVPYLGLVAHSSPLFLVNGNHEQAAKANLDGTPNSLGVMVQNARNRNYLQPAPDTFYTGNSEKVEHIGLLRNYFAWTWGDALFVTIDPYWHSNGPVDNAAGKGPKQEGGGKAGRNMWNITLGDAQYRWLTKTLMESKAKYKFVFAHHVNGTGRGGVENAGIFEWGGKGRGGDDEFKRQRPGWDLPIHQLFVKSGVSIFFQGHDHIFCKQELDGVIYQSCPCPADPTNSLINGDAYRTGNKVPGAGLVKVSIAPDRAKIEYVRAYEPSAEVDGHEHGEIAYSYEVKPKGAKS